MSRETLLQATFNTGVMSPRLYGRSDFKKYASAATRMSNVIPIASGPAVFRPGSVFMGGALSNSAVGRLIPFKFNNSQTYMMEFGNNIVRFFRNRAPVKSSSTIANGTFATGDLTSWTNNSVNAGTATVVATKLNLHGDGGTGVGSVYQASNYIGISQYTITADVTVGSVTVKIGTTPGATDIASGVIPVGVGQAFTFTPAADHVTFYMQFSNGANSTITVDNIAITQPDYTIYTPYATADLPALSYAQNADVVYFAVQSDTVPPQTLQRFGHNAWRFIPVDFFDGPYWDSGGATRATLAPAATSGSSNIVSDANIFVATDIGRWIRIKHSVGTPAVVTWGCAVITAFIDSNTVVADIKTNFGATTASEFYKLGAFSQTQGYPGLVTFHEGRLVYGNTRTYPNWLFLSESNGVSRESVLFAPTQIDGTVTDSKSIFSSLSAGDVSTILWMSSGNVLAIGTQDCEWTITGSDTTKALSPTNFRSTKSTSRGSAPNVPALRIDGIVLFAQGVGTQVNRFAFQFYQNQFQTLNMCLLCDNLFQGKKILYMAYQAMPFSLIWCMLDDGTLASLTFVDSEEVGGWSVHQIAGAAGGGTATGPLGLTSPGVGHAIVETIEVLPADTYNELWMIVQRQVNGSVVRHVEVLEAPFFLGQQPAAIYLDACVKYIGAPISTMTGLNHLEGQTVTLLVDGASHPDKVVTNGQVILDSSYSTIMAGLYYEGPVETLDFEASNAFGGSSMGQIRKITDVKFRIFETGLIYTGRTTIPDDKLGLLTPRSADDVMDMAPALKKGVFPMDYEGSWDLSTGIKFKFASPFPGTVEAIMYKAMVNEG